VVVGADTTGLLLSFGELGALSLRSVAIYGIPTPQHAVGQSDAAIRSGNAPTSPGAFLLGRVVARQKMPTCERHPRAGIRLQDQPVVPKREQGEQFDADRERHRHLISGRDRAKETHRHQTRILASLHGDRHRRPTGTGPAEKGMRPSDASGQRGFNTSDFRICLTTGPSCIFSSSDPMPDRLLANPLSGKRSHGLRDPSGS